MPYEINWERNGVVVRFTGVFDFKENVNANNEIYRDSRCDSINYAIWDVSDVSEMAVNEVETLLIAMQDQSCSSLVPKIKLAFLAQDETLRGFFNQYTAHYQSRKTGWDFKVFDNMESIRAWVTF